jgi:excisionase family DNA binding protein
MASWEDSLHDLKRFADEARLRDLPLILREVHSVTESIISRLADSSERNPEPGMLPDQNLSVKEAARSLGVSPSYLYKRRSRLPFSRQVGRRVLFSRRGLEAWMKAGRQLR